METRQNTVNYMFMTQRMRLKTEKMQFLAVIQLIKALLKGLLLMLDENNRLVHSFRMARDRFRNNESEEVELELVASRSTSRRPNPVGPSNF